MKPYLIKYKNKKPKTLIEQELHREANRIEPHVDIITEDMANEYYEWMDGTRRYLSFKDTLTTGQLDKLRILYEFKKDNELYSFIEQTDPEEKFRKQQIFHVGQFPPTKPKQKPKLRKTKWVRTRHHGVLQLRLRELEKDN